MANFNGHGIYEFDEFRLNVATMMLCRAEKEVSLPPKAVKTLAVLVENQGEIVSKDELIGRVWEDSIVEESNLSQNLYLLRKTLGNNPEGRPYIETLRRRGYRFTGKGTYSNGAQPEKTDEPIAAAANPGRHEVERRGNVVAMLDWKEAEERSPDTVQAAKAQNETGDRTYLKVALAIAFAGILLGGFAFYSYRSGAAEPDRANSELTVLRLTNGNYPRDATISPDGKYFVYHEIDGRLYHMWLQQTGYSSRVEIIPASSLPIYAKTFSPDGQFIYFAAAETPDGPMSLYRVPTLGGPVSKILSVLNSPVSLSPDGRELVFSRWDKEKRETAFLIKASDASGDERLLYSYKTEYAWEGSPAWSPDGKLIAFSMVATQEENRATCSLAVFPVNGGGMPTPVSDERWETCFRIVWSPDGRGLYMVGTKEGDGQTTRRDQIFYISYPQGNSRRITTEGNRHLGDALGVTKDGSVIAVPFNRASQIWVMDPKGDSRSAVQITKGLNDGRAGIAPMADGRVAYVTRTGDNLAVWSMGQDGSDQRELVADPTTIEEIRSGGDGRYLVFSAVQGRYQHLFRSNTDGSEVRQLSFGNSMEVDSSISHDGKWVAYASTVHTAAGYATTLWKVPIDGGEPISLKRNDCEMPHFSPDDKFISCVEAQKTIHILSPDGTLFRSFAAVPRATLSFGARWTPDGKAVTYIVDNNAEISNIWLQPIDGGPAKRLTDFTSGNIYHFAYSLDGTRLFLARGQQIRDAVLITSSDARRRQ